MTSSATSFQLNEKISFHDIVTVDRKKYIVSSTPKCTTAQKEERESVRRVWLSLWSGLFHNSPNTTNGPSIDHTVGHFHSIRARTYSETAPTLMSQSIWTPEVIAAAESTQKTLDYVQQPYNGSKYQDNHHKAGWTHRAKQNYKPKPKFSQHKLSVGITKVSF